MPYLNHFLVQCSGVFRTSNVEREVFSISWRHDPALGGVVGGFNRLSDDEMGQVGTIVSNWWARLDTRMCNNVFLTSVKANRIGADGKYLDNQTQEFVVPSNGRAGGAPASSLPYSVAVAMSLSSGLRGRSRNGRFFLPCPSVGIDVNGQIPAATRIAMVASTVTMMDALEGTPLGRLVVASNSGFNTPVNTIRCGSVPDTQRRRRNDLLEDYAGQDLASAS